MRVEVVTANGTDLKNGFSASPTHPQCIIGRLGFHLILLRVESQLASHWKEYFPYICHMR